jgi:hypothetical protein
MINFTHNKTKFTSKTLSIAGIAESSIDPSAYETPIAQKLIIKNHKKKEE